MRLPFFVPCFSFAFFLGLNACSAQSVLQLSLREAERRLNAGDVQFIIDSVPERMPELARIDPGAPFYAGLLLEKSEGATEQENKRIQENCTALFTAALKSPIVRQAAAKKLIELDTDAFFTRHSSDSTLTDGSAWQEAFKIMHEFNDGKLLTSTFNMHKMRNFF